MITDLLPWIEDGITIRKEREGGYQVFTVPTQHFIVNNLEELTPERFKLQIEKQAEYREMIYGY